MSIGKWFAGVIVGTICLAANGQGITREQINPVLQKLGVTLKVNQRPTYLKPAANTIEVTLTPQIEAAGKQVISFGVPFGPGVLSDDKLIRVVGDSGTELAAFTKPLAYWWAARRGRY